MTTTDTISGEIVAIENHGSIILVFVTTDDGDGVPVYFDHSPFCWLVESEGCEPHELVGRRVSFDGQSVEFIDEMG